jgi:hypothetical protein
VSHGQNVTVDVLIGSKCHSGRSELGRNVQAANPRLLDFAWVLLLSHLAYPALRTKRIEDQKD